LYSNLVFKNIFNFTKTKTGHVVEQDMNREANRGCLEKMVWKNEN